MKFDALLLCSDYFYPVPFLSLSHSHVAGNIDMAAVPAHLKCALSNTLLKEAVTLPCCNRVRPPLLSYFCFFFLSLFVLSCLALTSKQ